MYTALFAEESLEWHRINEFQNVALRRIAERMIDPANIARGEDANAYHTTYLPSDQASIRATHTVPRSTLHSVLSAHS